MSEDTSNEEVGLSSSGSVKLHIFHGNGKGVAFQVWFNRLESALEFNYIEQTIMLANYVVPASFEDAKKAGGTDLKHWRAKANIKLSLGIGPCSLERNEPTAYKMIQVLKAEYKIGSKMYDHRTLARQFTKCVLQDKENPTIFFNRLNELNEDFSLFSRSTGKDYKKDPTEMLMHIQENVGVDYDAVWIALEANSTSQTGTRPEELLKEAKHNLKEHWNNKLKDKAADEGDFIMVAREQKDKCILHCGKAHPSDKCWKKFDHLRPQNKGSKGKKKMVCWKCGGNHAKKECPKYKGNKESSYNLQIVIK